MPANWKRIGSYYQIDRRDYYSNKVTFVNLAPKKTIHSFTIRRHPDNKIVVTITPSPLAESGFNNAYFTVFGTKTLVDRYLPLYGLEKTKRIMRDQDYPTDFELDTPESLEKLKDILKTTHQEDPKLFKDLENILKHKPRDGMKHCVAEGLAEDAFVNPNRKHSRELITFLANTKSDKYTKKKSKQLCWLVSQGENVNQRDSRGRCALWYAVVAFKNIEILAILLDAGANPFVSAGDPFDINNTAYSYSPAELAKYEGFSDKLDIINLAFTSFSNPVTLKVKEIDVKEDDDRIRTDITFENNKKIVIIFITLNSFNTDKKYELARLALFNLFLRTFKSPDGDKRKVIDTFNEDFKPSPDNKNEWVELVVEEGKIIGANQYRLHELPENKSLKVVEWVYTLLEPESRGNKFMPALVSVVTHSNKKVEHDHDVAVYYSALNYSSYAATAKRAHTPVHMPPHMPKLLKEVLQKVYGNDVEFEWDGAMKWVVIEPRPLRVHMDKPRLTMGLNEQMFYSHYSNTQKGPAPVFSYIDRQSYLAAQEVSHELNMDFEKAVNQFAFYLRRMIEKNSAVPSADKRVAQLRQHFINRNSFFNSLRGPELYWGHPEKIKCRM